MAKKRRKKKRRRRDSDPGISPEQVDALGRRNMLIVGGAMAVGLGMVVGYNAYQSLGRQMALGFGLLVAVVTWFGFWINYGRKK